MLFTILMNELIHQFMKESTNFKQQSYDYCCCVSSVIKLVFETLVIDKETTIDTLLESLKELYNFKDGEELISDTVLFITINFLEEFKGISIKVDD